MPIYEYRCRRCKHTAECMRPIAESKEPLVIDCVCPAEGTLPGDEQCTLDRILSPVPTTFRFNDFKGKKGLDKRRRGM